MVGDPVAHARARLEQTGEETVRLVRIAGVLLLAGSLLSVPSGLALDPQPPPAKYLLAASGAAIAVVFLTVPARYLNRRWIHAALGLGVALTAAGVATFSDDYAFFYVVVAIYAALALRSRRELAVLAAVLIPALVVPLVYSDDFREQLHHILVTLPVLVISLLFVRNLRETLEARERTYRGFAQEAVELVHRIRRHSSTSPDPARVRGEADRRLEELTSRAGGDPPPAVRK